MIKYIVDFKDIGQTVGWYTYDIRANSVFEAACELFACCGEPIEITNISEEIKMTTYLFENGKQLQFISLGYALEYAHNHNTRIVRAL